MDVKKEQSLLSLARKASPHFVAPKDPGTLQSLPKVKLTFQGSPNPFIVRRILSFQGSLKMEFEINSRLCGLDSGCTEASFFLDDPNDVRKLHRAVVERDFDNLAYIYSIIAASFPTIPEAPEFRFYSEAFNL